MTDVVHTPRRLPERTGCDATSRIALVDLLDRVHAGGVVVTGEVTLSIADVDLVQVSLRTLISSVSTLERERAGDE